MPGKGSPARNVRVPDDLWEAAKEQAERDCTSVSAVLVAALRRYVGK